MHEELPDWLQDSTITSVNDRRTIALRAKGIDDLIENLSTDQISALVALAFGLSPTEVSSARHFREVFRKHDVGFKVTHDFALQVLSGATLLTLLEKELDDDPWNRFKALAATAVVSAGYGHTINSYYPETLLKKAAAYLNDIALKRRTLTEVNFSGVDPGSRALQQRLQKFFANKSEPTSADLKDFMQMLKPYADLLPKIPEIMHNQRVLQEETEMSWWVQAEYSRERNCPFAELSDIEAPGVLAYELAQRTRVFPAGVAARHLIGHILRKLERDDNPITLKQFGENADSEWLSNLTQTLCPVSVPRTTPIIFGLQLCHSGVSNWPEKLNSATAVDPDKEIPASKFGYALYLECLVRRMQELK